MIPVTVAMGAIASRVNDRVLTVFSMSLTLVGCLQLMNGGYPRCAPALHKASVKNPQYEWTAVTLR